VSRIAARTPVNEPMIPNNSAVFERMSKLLAIGALDILHFSMHLSLEGPLDPGASYWTRDSRGGGWSVLARIEWVRSRGRWRALPRGGFDGLRGGFDGPEGGREGCIVEGCGMVWCG